MSINRRNNILQNSKVIISLENVFVRLYQLVQIKFNDVLRR